MPITLKRVVVKIGGSLRVTIPTEIVEMMRIQAGDEMEFYSSNGDIVIRKAKK